MEMLYFLAAIGSHVHHCTVARLIDAEQPPHAGDEAKEGLSFAVIPLIDVGERRDVLARDHQNMLRSLRIDVAKR